MATTLALDTTTKLVEIEVQLLDLEEQFWKGNEEFYQHHLDDDSLMVFAEPVGPMIKANPLKTSAVGPKWNKIRFEEVRFVKLTDFAAIMTYKASAGREGEGSRYRALASSAYIKRNGSWKLAFHQQMPGA